jgi:hypothetical protein
MRVRVRVKVEGLKVELGSSGAFAKLNIYEVLGGN